jgi:hypothetical protein
MAGYPSKTNLGRIAKVVALLLFVLPWVSVSCTSHGLDRLADLGATPTSPGDVPIATATGLQLATGSVSYADAAPLSSATGEVSKLFDKPNPAVVGAAFLILVSLVASFFVKDVAGAILGMATKALAALALCYGVALEIPSKADALFHRLGGNRMGIEVHVNLQIGFYLCLAALVVAIAFEMLAMRGRKPAVTPPTALPPIS